MDHAEPLKNDAVTDRGYFLGQVLKHISNEIWDKINKEEQKKKLASIPDDVDFGEKCTMLLAEQVATKFPEEESFIHQIAVSETMEQIREAKLPVEESKEEAKEESESLEMQKQKSSSMNEQFQKLIEERKGLPNFTEIVTQTEKLFSSVAEEYFNCSGSEKLTNE